MVEVVGVEGETLVEVMVVTMEMVVVELPHGSNPILPLLRLEDESRENRSSLVEVAEVVIQGMTVPMTVMIGSQRG